MLRQVVGRHAFSKWPRKIAGAVSPGEQVIMHRVRMRPRKGLFRRTIEYGVTGVLCYYIWDYIAFLPLMSIDPESLPQVEPEELEPLFIPFPFTTTEVQPLPYAGAEEEWQDFVKFAKNDKLKQRVKNDLKLIVKRAGEKNLVTKKWAKDGSEFELGPSWLLFSYPEVPPPEFVRTGIEIGDTSMSIKIQKVDARTKTMIDRVLTPYPVASASYAFARAMVKQNVSSVAKYFGYQSGGNEISTTAPNPEFAKTLKKLEARQTAHGSAASSPHSTPATTASQTEPDATSSRSSATSQQAPTGDPEQSSKDPDRPMVKDSIPYYPWLAEKGQGPLAAFSARYKRLWRPLRYLPPRGSLAVHGLVALDSPKGRVLIEVFAWYHPKTKEFHPDSIMMNLKSISPNRQRAWR